MPGSEISELVLDSRHTVNDVEKGEVYTPSTDAVMNPMDRTSKGSSSPSPVGLCGFAITTFVQSLIGIQARSLTNSNIIIGLACFYGGIVQILTGIWELVSGNTFSATAFCAYGSFWLSYAAININAFGIIESYPNPQDFNNAMGLYYIGWAIFTFFKALSCIYTTITNFALFLCLDICYILSASSHFTGSIIISKVGGYVGILTALIAWYNAFIDLTTKQNSFLVLKTWSINPRKGD